MGFQIVRDGQDGAAAAAAPPFDVKEADIRLSKVWLV